MPMASSATKAAVNRSVFIGGTSLARRAASRIRPQRRRCTGRRAHGFGVPAVSFFDVDEGLAFDDIGAFCPQMAVRPEDAGDASRCQRAALACNDDAALVAAAPRAADLLARLGVALDDGGCLRAGLCGNGQLDGGEECDDGSANSDTLPDHCRTDCSDPWCGGGVVDPGDGEECEPPGTLLCDADCQDRLPLGPLGGLVRERAAVTPAVAQADGTAAPPEALAACQQA